MFEAEKEGAGVFEFLLRIRELAVQSGMSMLHVTSAILTAAVCVRS